MGINNYFERENVHAYRGFCPNRENYLYLRKIKQECQSSQLGPSRKILTSEMFSHVLSAIVYLRLKLYPL